MAKLVAVLVVVGVLAAPASGMALSRRACVIGAGALCLPKAASASYAMQQANTQGHTWTPTSKEAEMRVYESIDSKIDAKRRFSDEAGTLGYVGGEYTSYRRGAARDEFEANKPKKAVSDYTKAEDVVGAARLAQARRMAL
mgnify:CR=1 FL=1